MSVHDFTVVDIKGQPVALSTYAGKVLLIVNVASKCGFTKQYKGLEALYRELGPDNFAVLGFPCNQFMFQEPGSNESIMEFCSATYNVTFPMFSKVNVNGPKADPLYVYLRKEAKGNSSSDAVKWNFTKFLVDAKGNVIQRYDSAVEPELIRDDIVRLIKAKKQ